MHIDTTLGLLIGAATANALLAGASGDQSVKQLPDPTRWDPFFADYMSVSDIYHYPGPALRLPRPTTQPAAAAGHPVDVNVRYRITSRC